MTTVNYYDVIAHNYDALYSNNISLAENSIVQELILEQVPKNTELSVLDIGCGTGLVYEMLSTQFDIDYLGIDISEAMVSVAQNKHQTKPSIRFLQMDANTLQHENFADQSFDIVSSTFGSFSYINNPKEFLQKTVNLLKKDGIIFFMVYSQYSISNLRKATNGIESNSIQKNQPYEFRNSDCGIEKFPDSHFYTEDRLRTLCNEIECNSVEVHGLNYFLDHFQDRHIYEYVDCVDILKREMLEMSHHKDLAHSLICIIKK